MRNKNRTTSRDKIVDKHPMTIWVRKYKFEQSSLLRADTIEYLHNKQKDCFNHHLMFYLNEELIFKIWLPNSNKAKEFKSITEALKYVGMEVYE